MTRLSAHRLPAAQRLTAGWALQRVFGALYASQAHLTNVPDCTGAKAPARGGGRALRGGVQARLCSARDRGWPCSLNFEQGEGDQWRSEGPAPHAPRDIFSKKKEERG